jgi:short-subunit dehydrogenase
MKTFLFIGANSDIAVEARRQQEKKGNRVISLSRSDNSEFGDFLVADPLKNL